MRALVLGATGFLGLNIVEALQAALRPEDGDSLLCARRKSSNTILLRRFKVPMVHASLEDVSSLEAAMEGRDTVFMAAGYIPRFAAEPQAQVDEAVARMDNALVAARRAGVETFVYTGTVSTVARAPEGGDALATEDAGLAEDPGSTYFAVKIALERRVMEAAAASDPVRGDMRVVTLCPTACIGPYDHKVGTGFFVVGMATGQLSRWVDGRINVVDSGDVAAAHLAAARQGRHGARYILGGTNVRVGELLRHMAGLYGVAAPGPPMTAAEAVAFADAEEARVRASGRGRPALSREMVDLIVHGQFVDAGRARAELGFAPRPLDETLLRSFRWYERNGYLKNRNQRARRA